MASVPESGIRAREELEALYGEPPCPPLVKELDHNSAHDRAFIERSLFVFMATCGPEARGELPSAGQILQALLEEEFGGDQYARDHPECMQRTMS